MTENYILTFSLSNGKTKQVRVGDPNKDIPVGALLAACNKIIGSSALAGSDFTLASLKKAELRGVTKTVIFES